MSVKTISIIGTGNMGGAIALALNEVKDYKVSIYDSNLKKAEEVAKEKNIEVLHSLEDANDKDILIIAVKPQILPSLYTALSNLNPTIFISIAAGVSLKTLKSNLKTDTPIVRFMPNIAAKTRKAVTAMAFQANAKSDVKDIATAIATSFGSAFELEERLFPAFIGISGSAIAYVFEFMHQIAMGGVREGIAYNEALSIARDTLISATSLQKESNIGAIELQTMVCSAGGTTIEGIKALDDGAFGSAVINAVSAAADKSRELEKNS